MTLQVDDEFLAICREILGEGLNEEAWALIESDDMFQTERYYGGFDAAENAFCFEYLAEDDNRYWFQLNLAEIKRVAANEIKSMETRLAIA